MLTKTHTMKSLLYYSICLLISPFSQQVTSANIIINEIDCDTEGTDNMEFVELYDGGAGNTSLNGLVVVFFNGYNDLSYSSFDLDGYSTDTSGYFVLGNSLVPGVDLIFPNRRLQNGADAVALYEADGTDFPSGTAVTTLNILDAIVYATDDADDPGLLILLNIGEPQVNENMFNEKVSHSVQRMPNGSGGFRNTSTYFAGYPTPDAINKQPVVIDTIAPNIVCKDGIAYLGKDGTASIFVSEIDNGSSDNCGIDRLTLSRSSFSCSDLGAAADIDKVWVNEIHYDNEGPDVGEFVEIAGTAGIDLSGYNLLFYNGSNGKVYMDSPLSGVIDNEKDGFGALPFFIPDIQNGTPDGVALVGHENAVIEFISYEGGLTATNGAAMGMSSASIGVSEPSSTTVGYSLQRTGVGSGGGEFIWDGPITGSPGSINTGQEVKSPSGVVITLTGEDINGNVGSCRALVTVLDSIKPTAVCTDINVYVDAGGQVTIEPAALDGGSADNCGIIDWQAGRTIFSCSEIIVHEALWINELHYDNAGGDINEFIEIAGTAGISLGNFEVYLYNGTNGAVYGSSPLSGVIPDEGNGYGALYFLIPDMQNGAPDGIALVEDGRHLVEFISYEGSILATGGPAAGVGSTDIIVDESSSTPIGFSL
ncbi:Chitinase, partial [hydrothermal vent metagenome]